MYFWRTKSGAEVDFVVYGPGGFWAIEVKHSRSIRPKDLRPLKSFKEDYPEAKARFLYRGDEKLEIDGIRCMKCDDFLSALVPGSDLP